VLVRHIPHDTADVLLAVTNPRSMSMAVMACHAGEQTYESQYAFIFDAIIGERWVDLGGFNVVLANSQARSLPCPRGYRPWPAISRSWRPPSHPCPVTSNGRSPLNRSAGALARSRTWTQS
jgi:hypothetical protein